MSTKVRTNVTTITPTKIRDIGFTGQHAVDLVDILAGASLEREQLRSDDFRFQITAGAKNYERLTNGANVFPFKDPKAVVSGNGESGSILSLIGGGAVGVVLLLIIGFIWLRS